MDTSVGIVKTKIVTLFEKPNELELDCGQMLSPVQVAYETYGTLSAQKDNAILICHALTGDAHAAGFHREGDKPGWWENMIGPGKGIDTNKYFVISSNVLGGCKGTTGPVSINPATGKPWCLDFPVITIHDMVKVQKELVCHLGITRLLAVIGGSMGGMQILEWAIRYPDMVAAALPIATTTRLSAQAIAFNAVARNAILADRNFNDGEYYGKEPPGRGLAIARMIGHITYLSEDSMHKKFGRTLRNASNYKYELESEFAVETYLDYQGQRFVERFDANSYLYITKAIDYYDLTAPFGSLEKTFAGVKSRFLVVSFSSDWLFPPSHSEQMVRAMLADNKDVTYCNIQSPYGHDAFLLEEKVLGTMISGFLESNYRYLKTGQRVAPLADNPVEHLNGTRYEYPVIEELVRPSSKVLDLGCGNGSLLQILAERLAVEGRGIEIQQDRIVESIQRGVTVIAHDLNTGMPKYPDDTFDYIILSQTLPEVQQPEQIFKEMLRIGKIAIVSFPNFASWQARLQFAIKGRAPVTAYMPHAWYETERIRFLSLKDFEDFSEQIGAKIIQKVALSKNGRRIPLLGNFLAEQAVYVIARK
jgi:homoserine O-acetyltransferase